MFRSQGGTGPLVHRTLQHEGHRRRRGLGDGPSCLALRRGLEQFPAFRRGDALDEHGLHDLPTHGEGPVGAYEPFEGGIHRAQGHRGFLHPVHGHAQGLEHVTDGVRPRAEVEVHRGQVHGPGQGVPERHLATRGVVVEVGRGPIVQLRIDTRPVVQVGAGVHAPFQCRGIQQRLHGGGDGPFGAHQVVGQVAVVPSAHPGAHPSRTGFHGVHRGMQHAVVVPEAVAIADAVHAQTVLRHQLTGAVHVGLPARIRLPAALPVPACLPRRELPVQPGLHRLQLLAGGLGGQVLQFGVKGGVHAQSVLAQVPRRAVRLGEFGQDVTGLPGDAVHEVAVQVQRVHALVVQVQGKVLQAVALGRAQVTVFVHQCQHGVAAAA